MPYQIDVTVKGYITALPEHNTTNDIHPQHEQLSKAGEIRATKDKEPAKGDYIIPQDWTKKVVLSRKMSKMMQKAGYIDRALRMRDCGEWLTMYQCPKGDHQHVARASYCRDRLCPICAAARSRRLAREMCAEVQHLQREHEGVRWVFLTLTAPNVRGAEALREEIKRQTEAWRQMARRAPMRRAALGWVRKLEITYHEQRRLVIDGVDIGVDPSYGTHHVHIHALLMVSSDYFYDQSKYLSQREYQQEWANALGIDLNCQHLIVDVRPADTKGGVLEIAKYCVKASEYLAEQDEPEAIEALKATAYALGGVRTVSWGGEWRKARKALKHVDDDNILDEDISDVCPVCRTPLEEAIYQWSGVKYRATRRRKDIIE